MQLIATMNAPAVIQRILAHLGLPDTRDGPRPPSAVSAAPAEQPALPSVTPQPGSRGRGPKHARTFALQRLGAQVDSSHLLRRGSGLTFATRSGRIGARWGTFIRAVPRQEPGPRGAMTENRRS